VRNQCRIRFSLIHDLPSAPAGIVIIMMKRIHFLFAGCLAVALGLTEAGAQTYPDRPIKLVVPFTPGSPVDVLGRVIAQQLSGRLGQSVIIDNRPGAGTSIGAKAVATAEPDGHTLLLTGTNLVYLPELYRNLEFGPIKSFAAVAMLTTWSHTLVVSLSVPANTVAEFIAHARANPGKLNFKSFAAVAMLTTWSHTLVVSLSVPANTVAEFIAHARANPGKLNFKSFAAVAMLTTWSHTLVVSLSVPANTVAEFIAHARANPGKLNFGFGLGTTPQILGEYFKAITGADINSVPYRGGVQAISDMLGDRIHMNFGTTATLLALIRQGNVRALAYTGVTRHPDLPDVPTMIEAGLPQLAFDPDVCIGLLAPAGTLSNLLGSEQGELGELLW
jgi:tripartite-type tricarboxylate transporter receptor subunit TctC